MLGAMLGVVFPTKAVTTFLVARGQKSARSCHRHAWKADTQSVELEGLVRLLPHGDYDPHLARRATRPVMVPIKPLSAVI